MNRRQRQARLAEIERRCAELSALTEGDSARDLTDAEMAELTDLGAEAEGHRRQLSAASLAGDVVAEGQRTSGRQSAPNAPARDATVVATGGEPGVARDPWLGFRDAGDFASSVRAASPGNPAGGSRQVDERLTLSSRIMASSDDDVMTGRSGEDQGWLPPPAMRSEVMASVYEEESPDFFNLVTVEPTVANTVELFGDEATPWSTTGHIIAKRRTGREKLELQRDGSNQPRTIKVESLYVFVAADEDLLDDAPRLANRLTNRAGEAIRWKLSEEVIRGSGVGECLGILNSGALVTVPKTSGQAADTFTAANAANMYARCLAHEIPFTRWFLNQDVLPQVMQFTLGNYPIWTPPNAGFAGAPGGFLLGRPISFNEHMGTVGDVGDAMLASMRGFYMAMRSPGIKSAVSMHLLFDYGEMAFRWTLRVNGQPLLKSPVSPAQGSNTRSHFVTLAARA